MQEHHTANLHHIAQLHSANSSIHRTSVMRILHKFSEILPRKLDMLLQGYQMSFQSIFLSPYISISLAISLFDRTLKLLDTPIYFPSSHLYSVYSHGE